MISNLLKFNFLSLPTFTTGRSILRSTLRNLDCDFLENTNSVVAAILVFGKEPLNANQTTAIFDANPEFVLSWISTRRFNEDLQK